MQTLDPVTLRNAQQGDRASFALLVESYYPRALRFALQMLGTREDAEEAVQDAFIRVHDNLARFRLDAPFDPWFFRILGNRCRTLAVKRKRHHAVIDYGAPLPEIAHEPDIDLGGDTFAREVQRALESLPAEQREAFLLRHVNEMDYEEMTIVTGARGSTLRMRVKRAVDALRVRLRDGVLTEGVLHD